MNKTRILLLLLFLLVPSLTFSQTVRSTSLPANASWKSFYVGFCAAVNKRDRITMLELMPDDFFDGGGGLTAKEWLQFIDENEQNGSWKDLQKSFARGTVVSKNRNGKGIPTRV